MKKERQSSIFVESLRIIDICVMVDNPFTIETKTSWSRIGQFRPRFHKIFFSNIWNVGTESFGKNC